MTDAAIKRFDTQRMPLADQRRAGSFVDRTIDSFHYDGGSESFPLQPHCTGVGLKKALKWEVIHMHDRPLLIGTSGWMYKHWKTRFYPEDVAQKEWLEHYANAFKSAEINNSFYKLPSDQTFEKWAAKVPSDFIFSVKASRYLTHMKKLKEPLEPWLNVTTHAEHLGQKLGPILLQFPQRWTKNAERLRAFLEMSKSMETQHPLAFEFRNETWFDREIYGLLEKFDAALCIADSNNFKRVDATTAGYTYLRYHGRGDTIYAAKYSDDELKEEAKLIRKFLKQGLRVYVYFDNDGNAHAVQNAIELQKMLAA